MELNIFATPFNVEAHLLQLKIIQLQNNSELKARYNNIPLLEFYKSYLRDDEFPTLKKHALKYASVFGTTYTAANSSFQNSQLQKVGYVPYLPTQTLKSNCG